MNNLQEKLNFSIDEALANFRFIYPEYSLASITPVGVTNNGRLLVSVVDGYHVITDTEVSKFYETASDADMDN